MKTQGVTLEQLAEKLNKSIWEKGDLKRIYLNDAGYNTKKMSTKTFIFEKDGEFIVSCRIDCSSQPYQWISSQEEEVKNSIYEQIERIIEKETSEIVYCLVNQNDEFIDEFDKVVTIDKLYDGDYFFYEAKAIKSLEERSESLSLVIKELNKNEFFELHDFYSQLISDLKEKTALEQKSICNDIIEKMKNEGYSYNIRHNFYNKVVEMSNYYDSLHEQSR